MTHCPHCNIRLALADRWNCSNCGKLLNGTPARQKPKRNKEVIQPSRVRVN
jgi:hypothetical protein